MDREHWRVELEYAINQITKILSDNTLTQEQVSDAIDNVAAYLFQFIPHIQDHPDAQQYFMDRVICAAKERLTQHYSTNREPQQAY